MAKFTELVKFQKSRGRGTIGSITGAIKERSLEKFDPRNLLFTRGGLATTLFPSLKGYSAKTSTPSIRSLSPEITSVSQNEMVVKELRDISVKTSAQLKYSMVLPSIARDMNMMRQGIIKLVKLGGGQQKNKADMFFQKSAEREKLYESQFGRRLEQVTTPTRVGDEKKEEGGFFSNILKFLFRGLLVGGGLAAIGKILENEEIRTKIKEFLVGSLSAIFTAIGKGFKLLGETLSDPKVQESIRTMFSDIFETFKTILTTTVTKIETPFGELDVTIGGLVATLAGISLAIGGLSAAAVGAAGALGAIAAGKVFGPRTPVPPVPTTVPGKNAPVPPGQPKVTQGKDGKYRDEKGRFTKAPQTSQTMSVIDKIKKIFMSDVAKKKLLSILAKRGLTTAVASLSSGPLALFVALAGLGFTLYEITSLLDEVLSEDEKDLPTEIPQTTPAPVPPPTPSPTPAAVSSSTPTPAPTRSSTTPTANPSLASGFSLLNKVMDKEGIQDEETRTRIRRLAMIESTMNPNARGPVIQSGMHKGDRAHGILQIMPKTAEELGFSRTEISDPEKAATAGVRYFKKNLERFNGDLDAATVAHHAGPGAAEKFLATGDAGTRDVATGLSTNDYLAKVTGEPVTLLAQKSATPITPSTTTEENKKTPMEIMLAAATNELNESLSFLGVDFKDFGSFINQASKEVSESKIPQMTPSTVIGNIEANTFNQGRGGKESAPLVIADTIDRDFWSVISSRLA